MGKWADKVNSTIIKITAICVLGLNISTMTGCGMSVIALNEEETYEVARYMADKLLQYDRYYGTDELVYVDPTAPTEEPVYTEEPAVTAEPVAPVAPVSPTLEPSDNVVPHTPADIPEEGGNEATLIDWSEFFTTDDWVITYSSYDTCQSYPKQSDIYTNEASKGKKLLVISFDVINKTDKSITINLTEDGLNYKLHIGEEEYEPMISILDNGGLMFLNVKLKPYGQDEAVLIFEVPEGADLSNMRLDVSR